MTPVDVGTIQAPKRVALVAPSQASPMSALPFMMFRMTLAVELRFRFAKPVVRAVGVELIVTVVPRFTVLPERASVVTGVPLENTEVRIDVPLESSNEVGTACLEFLPAPNDPSTSPPPSASIFQTPNASLSPLTNCPCHSLSTWFKLGPGERSALPPDEIENAPVEFIVAAGRSMVLTSLFPYRYASPSSSSRSVILAVTRPVLNVAVSAMSPS